MGILGDIFLGIIGASCNFAEQNVDKGVRDYRLTEEEQRERDQKIRDSVSKTRKAINDYKSQNK
ncbi:MAG: hypothetical protein K2G04_00550 [Oscillospiraceae bacterium]|nr:hypothetical protein [Oscillospiraceae bacterium]